MVLKWNSNFKSLYEMKTTMVISIIMTIMCVIGAFFNEGYVYVSFFMAAISYASYLEVKEEKEKEV